MEMATVRFYSATTAFVLHVTLSLHLGRILFLHLHLADMPLCFQMFLLFLFELRKRYCQAYNLHASWQPKKYSHNIIYYRNRN